MQECFFVVEFDLKHYKFRWPTADSSSKRRLISEHLKCGHCRFIIVLTSQMDFKFYDFMRSAH